MLFKRQLVRIFLLFMYEQTTFKMIVLKFKTQLSTYYINPHHSNVVSVCFKELCFCTYISVKGIRSFIARMDGWLCSHKLKLI